MRWSNYTHFALLPKWCDCGHTVWLEKYYYVGDRDIGFSSYPIPMYECKKCHENYKKT